LSLVVEERKPVLWLARPQGVFLVSDDGIVLDRLNQVDLIPFRWWPTRKARKTGPWSS